MRLYKLRLLKINYLMDNGNRNAASEVTCKRTLSILGVATVKVKVRVKWEEDRNKLHPLHIEQTTMYLLINHNRTDKKKGKPAETHYGGYTINVT